MKSNLGSMKRELNSVLQKTHQSISSSEKQSVFQESVVAPFEKIVEDNQPERKMLGLLISEVNSSSKIVRKLSKCEDINSEWREFRRILRKKERRVLLVEPSTEEEFKATLKWLFALGNEEEDLVLIRKVKRNPPYFSKEIQSLFEDVEEAIIKRLKPLFQLLGHDNPLDEYPAPVIPIGRYQGEVVAVYLDSKNFSLSYLTLDLDVEYVKYDEQFKQNLGEFNYCRDRLFAFSENEVFSYPLAAEKDLFSWLLIDKNFSQDNPFLRRSLAKVTENIDIIRQELTGCINYLKLKSPDMIPSWYKIEKEKLSLIWQRNGLEFPSDVDEFMASSPLEEGPLEVLEVPSLKQLADNSPFAHFNPSFQNFQQQNQNYSLLPGGGFLS